MKIALLGGGGFRTPLTFAALRRAAPRLELDELVLYDLDPARLATMCRVLDAMLADTPGPRLIVSPTTELVTALRGASYVLCAIRVGGLHARALDERLAINAGVVGQETVGAGGLCLLMRSVPILTAIAEHVARAVPHAWFINFTNPVGAISGILRETLGDRVIGVCDTPAELMRRVAALLQCPVDALRFDYFGLNHLGWLRGVYGGDCNLLPGLLADETLLSRLEETRLFGAPYLRQLGMLPIEYLTYYYFPKRHLAAVAEAGQSRAEYLLQRQHEFYSGAVATPAEALALWHAAKAERERSYLSDAGQSSCPRAAEMDGNGEGHGGGDGYAALAVRVLEALATNAPSTAIVDVANGRTLRFLPAQATVEVSCTVDASGVRPARVDDVPEHASDLMQRVYAAEDVAIRAARTRSRNDAIMALAAHPLVESTARAERLFAAYLEHQPQLAAVFA